MRPVDIVIDTNVFYAGLRSNRGASFLLLSEIGKNRLFQVHISVSLILQYEEIAKRHARSLGLTYQDIDEILDYFCSVAEHHDIFYLWRPCLPDPDDDMLLELAVEAECDEIITYNTRDFRGTEQFGIGVSTPLELLRRIGVLA